MITIYDTQEQWRQAAYDVLKRQDRPVQHHVDTARIHSLRRYMQASATARVLLEWADRAGVEIWIDHQLDPAYANGYTTAGSNTVVLSGHISSPLILAGTLGHEIMHIWHDHNNLLPHSVDDPFDVVIAFRLTEAIAAEVSAQIKKEIVQSTRPAMGAAFAAEGFANFVNGKRLDGYDRGFKDMIESALFDIHRPLEHKLTFSGRHFYYSCNDTLDVVRPARRWDTIEQYGVLPTGANILAYKIKPHHVSRIFNRHSTIFPPHTWQAFDDKRAEGRAQGISKITFGHKRA